MDISIYAAINLTAELIGALVLMILIVSLGNNGDIGSKKGRLFFLVLIFTLLQFLGDSVTWLLDGRSGALARALCITGNFTAFIFLAIAALTYTLYICVCIGSKTRAMSAMLLTAAALSAACIFMVVVSQWNGIIYSISADNIFCYGPYYELTILYAILIFLLDILLVLFHYRALGVKSALVISSYAYIPLLTSILHLGSSEVMYANVGFFMSLIIVYTSYQSQENQRTKLALQEAQVAIMLSQIQPHFLFNSLTAIGKLSDIDPRKSKEAINDFADYLRANLESLSERELIPFKDELIHVEAYLALEQLRFDEKLHVVYDIQATDFTLPPLTVQPIVENAVRYGLTRQRADGTVGGTLTIRVKTCGDAHEISVIDDGVGFMPDAPADAGEREKRAHIGIENVRGRLKLLCNGTLDIRTAVGIGTSVVITIPKQ